MVKKTFSVVLGSIGVVLAVMALIFCASVWEGRTLLQPMTPLVQNAVKTAPDNESASEKSSAVIGRQTDPVHVGQAGLLVSNTTKKPAPVSPKTVYLTFDDGPSDLTGQVLDILKKNKIGATFFVLGEQVKKYPQLISRIYEEGHAIGNHTYDHNYTELYQSFPAFWDQIKETEEEIRLITGERPQLVRAPGGTAGHFDDTYFKLLQQAGYVVTDWNVDSGDSKRRDVPAAEIVKGATTDVPGGKVVLLMHDGPGHSESVKALPQIISWYKARGYQFGVLSPQDPPVQFKVNATARGLKRSAPSAAWIQSHIAQNAALFEPGKPLRLDVGGLETTLDTGEYSIVDGHYMVPLRALTERIGGSTVWDSGGAAWVASLSADAAVSLRIHADTGRLEAVEGNQVVSRETLQVLTVNGSLWVPLRSLFEASGYAGITASVNEEERRVTVF
ncbi:polysaccharide deacetylase [Paenibacillus cineris]|uniref:NodB homology domain-containing protein n=1 Tax=Paenibacillus cineris TaxID=237530 RepID=A0ABQ4LJ68_9BACL|nr:polysaccharide deacetylase [Paenibacillus cineris]GIO56547.1 hypothetical protein J21TS7_48650 [Paenibacillus cineris]